MTKNDYITEFYFRVTRKMTKKIDDYNTAVQTEKTKV